MSEKQRCPRCAQYRPSLVVRGEMTSCASCLLDDVEKLEAENARLREALTVISRENFTSDECGEIADEALGETDTNHES